MTRSDAEAEVIGMAGPGMVLVSLDGTTVDGTNAALNAVFYGAFRAIGIRPLTRAVAEADPAWAAIPEDDEDQFIAVAMHAAFSKVLGRWGLAKVSQNSSSYDPTLIIDGIKSQLSRLDGILAGYGIGVPTLGVGLISLGIVEPADDFAEFG